MTTKSFETKKLYFKNISNIIEFNNWLKKNMPLYESYDDDEFVPESHIKEYLKYLKDLITKEPEGSKVFERKAWEDKINELLEDKAGKLIGR